ncbi:MAG: four helix bundle protein [Balneolaceae bacterium]
MNTNILEERLIDFSVLVIKLIDGLPPSKAITHLSRQLLRSGTSPALNYAEARSAESTNDFIHKLQIVLKELRETFVGLKIIHKADLHSNSSDIEIVLNECNQLISIFVKSVQTAKKGRSDTYQLRK